MAADAKVQQAASSTDELVRGVVALKQLAHARFPLLAESLHGEAPVTTTTMDHLYQLPLNVLADMRKSITAQLYGYELVVASVNMHYQEHGAQGKAARDMFDTYASFDA